MAGEAGLRGREMDKKEKDVLKDKIENLTYRISNKLYEEKTAKNIRKEHEALLAVLLRAWKAELGEDYFQKDVCLDEVYETRYDCMPVLGRA